jgi:tryptophan-rich sensory protein
MQTYNWYQSLIKPSWSPPAWLFGPVWSVLYLIIFVTFGTVFWRVWQKQLPMMIAVPFLLNIMFNALFTTLQFGLKNNWLASLDILLVLGTLIWALVAIYPYARWIVWLNTPYLLWVMFATGLQLTITYLNK